jgi:hypothetical protein
MAKADAPKRKRRSPFTRWFLREKVEDVEQAQRRRRRAKQEQRPWWQVMCLTGVDYFSTLGYQPGIAALAAGALSPIATLVLVLVTLLGAVPIYRRVADESPHGAGSIAMLENLFSWWTSKLFVLCLLGFVATDFIITITLSTADATAHIVENPFTPGLYRHHAIAVTVVLIAILGGVFLKGFKEAIGLAVAIVSAYLLLNAVVIGDAMIRIFAHPEVLSHWRAALFASHGDPLMMIALAALLFPKLALGLSGFETGVSVMPHVLGDRGDSADHPEGRIRNTRRLLLTAAVIMSVFLIASSFVTITLIPMEEFRAATATHVAGRANGRALAYLAHANLGEAFGTLYDLSTILILWFAGASAMAGLINIVPRYLPRYGMAPEWARAVRPLVIVYVAIAFAVTLIFRADVDAQGGAYATGVLVLMTSSAIAVTFSARRRGARWGTAAFGLITAVFIYTTIANVIERPEGIKIAAFFIGAIIVTSLISRVRRSTELRTEKVEMDETAERFIREAAKGEIHIIAIAPGRNRARAYDRKEREQREDNHIPKRDPVLFLEVTVTDASEFAPTLEVRGAEVGDHRILRAESSAVPNAIAALLLHVRDVTGKIPHAYFSWSEGNPILYLLRFVAFGEGDTAPITREVLRKAEPDPDRRPAIHVGG